MPSCWFRVAARSGALRGLRGHGGTVAFLGAVQLAAPFLLITIGERWISSSLAGILVASAPIFIAFLALRVDSEERSAGRQLVGVGTGMAGVALLLGIDVGTGGLELIGALFVLLASLAYAVGALVLKRRLGEVQPVAMAAGAVSAGAAYLLLPAALTFPTSAPSLDAAAALVALGVGGTGLAFLLFYTLIAEVGPARASVVAYLAPGFAVFYGVTVRDELVTPWTLVGLARSCWRAPGSHRGRAGCRGASSRCPPHSEAAPADLGRSRAPDRNCGHRQAATNCTESVPRREKTLSAPPGSGYQGGDAFLFPIGAVHAPSSHSCRVHPGDGRVARRAGCTKRLPRHRRQPGLRGRWQLWRDLYA